MDDIGKIVFETIRISTPEFVRLAFAGMAGGLLGAYIGDRLTRKRESASGKSARLREFRGFMQAWRIEIENFFSESHVYHSRKDYLTETLSDFANASEAIRMDFEAGARERFGELVLAVTSCRKIQARTRGEHCQRVLKAIDDMIAFVETYSR